MKFLHISDLHLGKRVYEFSMLEDQRDILEKMIGIAVRENVDAVLIAGDVYDRQVPSTEAVRLFDWFLTELAERGMMVFVISGNHDSAERLSFGAKLMEGRKIYLSGVFDGKVDPIILQDAAGEVCVYLLPFLKPAYVRACYFGQEIADYDDALRVVLEHMELDSSKRNILVAHQFLTGALRSESEEVSVGGIDQVSAAYFSGFDYTALGHLHRPQNVAGGTIRYCGAPLSYSFSEADQEKTVTVVDMPEKGQTQIHTVLLVPRRKMRNLRGSYMELTARQNYDGTQTEDYLHVTLTDEEEIPGAIRLLRVVYPNIMKLDYDNVRTRSLGNLDEAVRIEKKTPLELFEELYRLQNNQDFSESQRNYLTAFLEELQEVEP